MLALKLKTKYKAKLNHLIDRFGPRCKGFYIVLRLKRGAR